MMKKRLPKGHKLINSKEILLSNWDKNASPEKPNKEHSLPSLMKDYKIKVVDLKKLHKAKPFTLQLGKHVT